VFVLVLIALLGGGGYLLMKARVLPNPWRELGPRDASFREGAQRIGPWAARVVDIAADMEAADVAHGADEDEADLVYGQACRDVIDKLAANKFLLEIYMKEGGFQAELAQQVGLIRAFRSDVRRLKRLTGQ
jgi:hypothetical protein